MLGSVVTAVIQELLESEAGDNCGLLLRGTKREEVERARLDNNLAALK